MKTILFDASVHLGQFCTSNEEVRRACKNVQAAISFRPRKDLIGTWTDLENGRVDKTIWNLRRELQENYYAFMDPFFSLAHIRQPQTSNAEEEAAFHFKKEFPALSVYSRQSCIRAIQEHATQINTLFKELLDNDVRSFMTSKHGIEIRCPSAEDEHSYGDAQLESHYQSALCIFRSFDTDPLVRLVDVRQIAF